MDGILLINKTKGYTSHDIVNKVRRKLNIKKVGHTGTLDPNATGVLPILVGQATKISKYLIDHDKTYIAELKLGEKSNTGDAEGEIIETSDIPKLTSKEVEKNLNTFKGKQKQTPPIYSAIKVNGKKAYEYARENKDIKLDPRNIEIYNIKLLELKENIIRFEVSCSKGTYIRVLCEDIAEKLGTVGLMLNLERTQIDNHFCINDSIDLESLLKKDSEEIEKNLISIESMFMKEQKIVLNSENEKLFLNGVKISFNLPDNVYRIYVQNKFIGLGIIKDKQLKRDIVLQQ